MSSGVIVGYHGSECAQAALRVALDVGHAYGEKVVIAFGYEISLAVGEVPDSRAALREMADRPVLVVPSA